MRAETNPILTLSKILITFLLLLRHFNYSPHIVVVIRIVLQFQSLGGAENEYFTLKFELQLTATNTDNDNDAGDDDSVQVIPALKDLNLRFFICLSTCLFYWGRSRNDTVNFGFKLGWLLSDTTHDCLYNCIPTTTKWGHEIPMKIAALGQTVADKTGEIFL